MPPCLRLLLSSTSTNLPSLRCAHALLLTTGSSADRFLCNSLLSLYSRHNSLPSALQLFDAMPHPDSVSYNSLLSAFAHHSHPLDAFSLFRRMRLSDLPLTRLTFAPLFKLCSGSRSLLPVSRSLLPVSRSLHSLSIKLGLDSDPLLSSSLVALYAKFGLLLEAQYLFDRMTDRDVILWNVLIKGYAQVGLLDDAFLMFSQLHRSVPLQPNGISVHWVVTARGSGIELDQVRAYGIKSCLLDDVPDSIARNKIMSENVKNGDCKAALDCFMEMKRSDVGVDNVTFVILLSAVSGEEWFELGKQVHGMGMKAGFCSDVSVSNSLINMYAKMASFDCSRRVFEDIDVLDLVSWNSIISASVQNGLEEESVSLFLDMVKYGEVPDQFTLASILRTCSALGEVLCLEGQVYSSLHQLIHCFAIKMGLLRDSFVLTALIDVYAKKTSMKEAESLFEAMDWFDLVSFNALVTGYVANSNARKALDLFTSLHRSGEEGNHFTLATILKACSGLVASQFGKQIHGYTLKLGFGSDLCVSSGLLDMYIKCGNIKDASAAFGDVYEPDDVAWTAMISGCVENGDEDRALSLYHRMRRSGALPDEFTLASLIKACSCLAALGQGRQIHADAIKLDRASDNFVATSIMDMYAKCGSIEDSGKLFKRMGVRSVASWNVMLLGFAQHGNGKEVLCLFKEMTLQGLRPDKITFVGVLSACSHSGLVSEAYDYFDSMRKDYGIEPETEHYSCLVDVLGRAGLLSRAEEVIETMPFDPSPSMCRALLGACRIQGNMEVGQRVARRLLDLEPLDPSAYVLLSNIYAAANRWDGVADARSKMKSQNVRKDPGCSWIEVKNKVHLFVVDDRSHPKAEALYDELEDLIRRIKGEGYVPDTDFVLLDVAEEEKERSLYYHSEKLAIAYGLLSTPAPQIIRVIKNLRVCGDCHNAIKYISKVASREILLRDASRFHFFKDVFAPEKPVVHESQGIALC